MRRLLAVLGLILSGCVPALAVGGLAPATAGSLPGEKARVWLWPLDPEPPVVRGFDPPASPYGPGHRGVDLAGTVGQRVLAIGDGEVSFAGSVAGRGVVVVDHGALSSTYQPVTTYVARGDPVVAGQPLGALQLLHSHCAPTACLHLGVKRGDRYLDPLSLLPDRPVRLLPLDGRPARDPRTGRATGLVRGGASGAWVGLTIGGAQPFSGDVGVELGGGQ